MYLLSFCVQIASLKRMKKELESRVEEAEDELDDANIKIESLQQVPPLSYPLLSPSLPPPFLKSFLLPLSQTKTRLELAIQSMKQQHQKEIEAREEDLEQMKSTMGKKLKHMESQLEEEHEQKQAAIRVQEGTWSRWYTTKTFSRFLSFPLLLRLVVT